MADKPDILGAHEVIDRVGRWPSFHDAEVSELDLQRNGPSLLVLLLADHPEPSCRTKVIFTLTDVVGLELGEFNEQNVLGSMDVEADEDGCTRLRLWPCYGLNGWIKAKGVSVAIREQA